MPADGRARGARRGGHGCGSRQRAVRRQQRRCHPLASPATPRDSPTVTSFSSRRDSPTVTSFFSSRWIEHRLNGANPAIAEHLVTLAWTEARRSSERSGAQVSRTLRFSYRDFTRHPAGGALEGEHITVTGPTRRLDDEGIIADDPFGHGHRLRATAAVPASTITALLRRPSSVTGRANVTNAASRVFNWPIDVAAIAPA